MRRNAGGHHRPRLAMMEALKAAPRPRATLRGTALPVRHDAGGEYPSVPPWVGDRDSYVMRQVMAARKLGDGPGEIMQTQVPELILTQYLCVRRRLFFPRHSWLYDWEWRAGNSELNFKGDLLLWNGIESSPGFLAVELKAQGSDPRGIKKAKVESQARIAEIFAHSYLSDVHYQRSAYRQNSNISCNNNRSTDAVPGDDPLQSFGGRLPIVQGIPFTDQFHPEHVPGLTREQCRLLSRDFEEYRRRHRLRIDRRGRARVVPRRVAKKEGTANAGMDGGESSHGGDDGAVPPSKRDTDEAVGSFINEDHELDFLGLPPGGLL